MINIPLALNGFTHKSLFLTHTKSDGEIDRSSRQLFYVAMRGARVLSTLWL